MVLIPSATWFHALSPNVKWWKCNFLLSLCSTAGSFTKTDEQESLDFRLNLRNTTLPQLVQLCLITVNRQTLWPPLSPIERPHSEAVCGKTWLLISRNSTTSVYGLRLVLQLSLIRYNGAELQYQTPDTIDVCGAVSSSFNWDQGETRIMSNPCVFHEATYHSQL